MFPKSAGFILFSHVGKKPLENIWKLGYIKKKLEALEVIGQIFCLPRYESSDISSISATGNIRCTSASFAAFHYTAEHQDSCVKHFVFCPRLTCSLIFLVSVSQAPRSPVQPCWCSTCTSSTSTTRRTAPISPSRTNPRSAPSKPRRATL